MKKIFRWLLVIVLVIIVLAGGFAAFIAIRGIPHYKAEQISLKVESTPQRVARGQVLVSLLCRNCHFDPNTNKFTGRKMDEVPQFGEVYSKNITHDPVHGIGKWKDGEIAYLLTYRRSARRPLYSTLHGETSPFERRRSFFHYFFFAFR